ncbi:MAG: GntR family transcriptional regulator, partial [bacterium]|nr:GntR family transcriptional regulator [bacterium]
MTPFLKVVAEVDICRMETVQFKEQENVKQELIDMIKTGPSFPKNKLPGERSLASQFKVSRYTLRGAIDELVKEGLLERNHGSGTFIRSDVSEKVTIGVPVFKPEKIMVKHFLGKLAEHAFAAPNKPNIRQIPEQPLPSRLEIHKHVIELFTQPEPAGLSSITINDLPWLADLGFCEDLTDRVSIWPARDNIFQTALEAVTYKDRIYALPFHCTLGCL